LDVALHDAYDAVETYDQLQTRLEKVRQEAIDAKARERSKENAGLAKQRLDIKIEKLDQLRKIELDQALRIKKQEDDKAELYRQIKLAPKDAKGQPKISAQLQNAINVAAANGASIPGFAATVTASAGAKEGKDGKGTTDFDLSRVGLAQSLVDRISDEQRRKEEQKKLLTDVGGSVFEEPKDLDDKLRGLAPDSESDEETIDLRYDEQKVQMLGKQYQKSVEQKKKEEHEAMMKEEEETRRMVKEKEAKRKAAEQQDEFLKHEARLRKEREAKLAALKRSGSSAPGIASASAIKAAGAERKKLQQAAGMGSAMGAQTDDVDDDTENADDGKQGEEVRRQIQELQLESLAPPSPLKYVAYALLLLLVLGLIAAIIVLSLII